ncbi:MAG: DUF5615 family PIN-like protein [Anaerolineae bacterium]|nr:DUF5615 family PIN-like protein [Thermoflexales bacterium]MDW8394762.1 DUF5615 family PIN-like protein [Anaerolineae bacterium]
MLRLLADECFNNKIIHGLLQSDSAQFLDIVRMQDVDLIAADDPRVLEWAAVNNRIVLTHDAASMPKAAYEGLAAGKVCAGVFVVRQSMPIGDAIREIAFIARCSTNEDWRNRIVYLPLR